MAKNEQPPLYMLRRGDKLIPEMQLDRELLQRFSEHDRIKVTLHTGRSPSRLRWYFAFLQKVIDATECAPSKEALHDVIKLHTGLVTPVMVKGFTVAVPKSVSFSSMGEEEFNEYLAKAVKWVSETYGITPEQAFSEAA